MKDIFDKIATDPVLQRVKAGRDNDYYAYFRPLSKNEGTEVVIDGRRKISLGSNNYLGLATHPIVRQAAIDAIAKYGTSCSGSRFLNGTLEIHQELERRLAKFVGKEAAIVFATGYQSNLGVISAVMGRGDIAICDKEAHACIFDGVRMSGCEVKRFRHNDINDLERVLVETAGSPRMVFVDGVYSMGGDLAPLPEIVALCKHYGARLCIDDAHGLGVMGAGGHGTAHYFNCIDDVDLLLGTLSKAFASVGGVVAGRKDVIDFIKHRSRSLIFSAALSPANVATVLACLDIIESDPSLTQQVHRQADKARAGLRTMGFNCGESVTPIVPVLIGDEMKTLLTWKEITDRDIYVHPIVPPGVPAAKSLIRTSYMTNHTDAQIESVLATFGSVGKQMGLI